MKLEQFLDQRKPSWQELENLLKKTKNGTSALSKEELDYLGILYRTTTSDLAIAQRDFSNQRVAPYLNQLVGRAHAHIYQGDPLRWQAVKNFYTATFPQLYRDIDRYTTLSFLLFIIPCVASFFLVWANPDMSTIFIGENARIVMRQLEEGKLWTEIDPVDRSFFSAAIMTNNIRVIFLTFAGGMLAGLLSAWVMVSNGLSIGATLGMVHSFGLTGLWEFISAHGFIELSVIFLAGGCGLYMGDALIRPGLLSRKEALIQRAQTSILLILGCAPFLVIAGLIEGIISPSGLPWFVKLAVGVVTGIALHAYWMFGGRKLAI